MLTGIIFQFNGPLHNNLLCNRSAAPSTSREAVETQLARPDWFLLVGVPQGYLTVYEGLIGGCVDQASIMQLCV